jgi:hypothetical protein
MKLDRQPLRLIASVFILTIAWSITVRGQTDSSAQPVGGSEQLKLIPFSVTAGVPVGGAPIGVRDFTIPFGDPTTDGPVPFFSPVVLLPPGRDSFVTQNIVPPLDLAINQAFFVDIFFSAAEVGPVVLSMTMMVTEVDPPLGSFIRGIEPRDGVVQIEGGDFHKVTFWGVNSGGADVLTIQIGRKAQSNPRDANPGVIRLEAVKISDVPQ